LSIRARWAIAVLLAATAATVSNAYAQPKPGQGSLGARIGVPYFLSDFDTKDGQKPRILASANFGYRFSPNWRLMTDFGFGWVIYKDDAPLPYKVTNSTDSIPATLSGLAFRNPSTVAASHSSSSRNSMATGGSGRFQSGPALGGGRGAIPG